MKQLLGVFSMTAMLFASQAWCGSLPDSPLLGTWEVDIARLPVPPEARPQRVTVTFAEGEGGQLATRVEVIDPTGASMVAEGLSALDGKPAAVSGNLEADTAAASMPEPNVLVMQLARANVPGSTRIYTVAPDGKSMTETAANWGDNGRPLMRVNHFSRVK